MPTVTGKYKYLIITAALAAVIIVYYRFDPTAHGWMPRCPSKLITHYDCPSCGSQRIFHALLHGRWGEAWHLNPFFFFAMPFFLLVIWGSIRRLPYSQRIRAVTHSRPAVMAYIAAYILWWILRNV